MQVLHLEESRSTRIGSSDVFYQGWQTRINIVENSRLDNPGCDF